MSNKFHRLFTLTAVSIIGAVTFATQVPRALGADTNALPTAIAANDPNIRYIGRFDQRAQTGPRCQWPASTVALKFRGTDLNVRLNEQGHDRWQVEVDGQPTTVLEPQEGQPTYAVATGLPAGEHTARLVKCTESFVGTTQILGFQLNQGGQLLPQQAPQRRLEIIGDSISCGYGNEAPNQQEHFSLKTENAYYTYGAIAARALGADYTCIAWSGKKMWPDNTMPELYGRALPLDPGSKWDFTQWTPDVVLINLATNDFGKENPDEAGWTGAYKGFIGRLRQLYPKAEIYCAIGTMMGDWGPNKPLTTVRDYLGKVVADSKAAGDTKVHLIDFGTQDLKNGIGADWHPSRKTHEIMAQQLVKTLQEDLAWR
ncbi:MAG: hypothetical protein JO316_04350 [Abitibacteriaceae bacterium]|nr:hypothetical protein [Abditibacteriaceae bacterium]